MGGCGSRIRVAGIPVGAERAGNRGGTRAGMRSIFRPGSFARMKELERRFAEPFSSYRQRGPALVDGIDIVKALARMGMAERKDIAKAVREAVHTRDQKAGSQPFSRYVATAVREALGAAQRAQGNRDRGR